MKKVVTVCLLVFFCFAAVACSGGDNTPEGMKDAAVAGAEYHLYVPEGWVLNNESGVSGAYASASERSNVTLTTYLPDAQISAETYFNDVCLPQYQNGSLAGFTLIGDQCADTTLGGLNAKKYVYVYSLGGTDYETMQVVVSTGSMIYNLTYTATAAAYANHLEDVESIIANFVFR